MSESSERLDLRTSRHIKSLYIYTTALERGDLDTIAVVLREAEQDAILERMIFEVHQATNDSDNLAPAHPAEVTQLQNVIHAHLLMQQLIENRANSNVHSTVPLSHNPSFASDVPIMEERTQQNMNTPIHLFAGTQPTSSNSPARKSGLSMILQPLVAIVVVGILVSSFIALFTLRHHPTNGGPQMSSTNTTTGQTPPAPNHQSTFITVAASDGTVYALQPESGKVLWQYATHQEVDTMVQQNGIVYIATSGSGTRPNYLYKFRGDNGALLWEKEYSQLTGYSVIAVEDTAIAISGGEGDGSMDVVKASDGSLLWRYTPANSGGTWSYPMIAVNNHVVYIRTGTGMQAFQLETGKSLWTSTALPMIHAMTFVGNTAYAFDTFNNLLIATLNTENGHLIKKTQLPFNASINFFAEQNVFYLTKNANSQSPQNCAYRIEQDGNISLVWCTAKGLAYAPVVMGDTYYYSQILETPSQSTIQVGALRTNDGSLRWLWSIDGKNLYDAINFIQIVGTNGIIYMTTRQGLFAVSANNGSLLWHLLTDKNLQSFARPSVAQQSYILPN